VDKSIPYHQQGRQAQKSRTRAAIVEAAIRLVEQGGRPTVDSAAAEAGVGRGTAYRYFPNQRALLAAAHPEVVATSLLPPDAPADPLLRLRIAVREITAITRRTEASLRVMLRLSLDDGRDHDLPLRKGRRIIWVADALEPLRATVDEARLDALVLAIAASCGIEAYVWLRDIAGLEPDRAADALCWTVEAIYVGALGADAPALPARRRSA
jgi:AcrR family transcriptional regulator